MSLRKYLAVDEIRLVMGDADTWKERRSAWLKHLATYTEIKCGPFPARADCSFWKETRIEFLIKHLDIVDSKCGSLLAFQGLVATATGTLLSWFLMSFGLLASTWFRLGLTLFVGLWFSTTFLLLLGFVSRLYWGDLGRDSTVPVAEEHHVRSLVNEVIRRTSKYRVAVLLAFWNVLLLLLMIVVPAGKHLLSSLCQNHS